MNTDKLFQPFKIKNHTIKNRIGVAPMTRMSGDENSIPRKDVLDFLVTRARNGAGIVYTEALVTDYESAQGYPGQARITNEKQIEAWKPVIKEIQAAGSKAVIQFFHCGRMAWPEVNPAHRSIAPSPIAPVQANPLTGKPYPVPEEMSLFDIDHVITGFVESARGAVAAGFDGIEIHGAHGYLISQFLSSHTNQRNDAYGGTVENRFRFAQRIIRAVKAVVPDDVMLLFRISNWGIPDMGVSLFADADEWQKGIEIIDKEGVDAISVSTYDFSEKAFNTDYTMARLTREVTDLPILICGRIYDRKSADAAIADADIALSGKSILLNPDFVNDLKTGKPMSAHSSSDANVAYTKTPLP